MFVHHRYVPHYLEQRTRPITNSYADFAPATPLVPFGFGLSYTSFTFSNAHVLNAAGKSCDERQSGCAVNQTTDDYFQVAVDVKNEGQVAGKAVVQVG